MLSTLIPIIEEAGALALSHFRQLGDGEVTSKGPLDLVTTADRAVEALLVARLKAAFPDDGVFGEEGARDPGRTGRIWVIDPIDGTFNFVRGRDDWAVSIGLHAHGEPTLGVMLQPVRRRLLTGGRGVLPCLDGRPLLPLAAYDPALSSAQLGHGGATPLADPVEVMRGLTGPGATMVRMSNASTAAMIEVITGEVDGYVSCGDASWDLMGTWPVAIALGAISSLDWKDQSLDARARFFIGKPGFVERCKDIRLLGQ